MGLLTSSYSATLDPASLMRLAKLMDAASIFSLYYTAAMNFSVNKVKTEAATRAPVVSGNLRRSAAAKVLSPWEGMAGFTEMAPYARRREFGFDDSTDSLGRYYPMDPADPSLRANMHFLQRGYEASLPAIAQAYASATTAALVKIAY